MNKDSRVEILNKIKLGLYGDTGHEQGVISTRDAQRDFGKEAKEHERARINNQYSLLEQLYQELLDVNAVIFKAAKEENLKALIFDILRKKSITHYTVWESDYLNSLGLNGLLKGEGFRRIISKEKNVIAEAGIGITGADYAIADTGTLVLLTDENKPRSFSLLPPIHLVIIRRADIVSDIRELFVLLQQRLDAGERPPSCMTFITGPSRTADIELNLTLGVHGPKELYVIII